jgi:hypothetical protein
MKKVRLRVEDLDVETFRITEPEQDSKGTVFANSLNPNCGHTPDQQCMYTTDTMDPAIPCTWSPYCDPTYTCDTFTECTYGNG